MDLTELMSVAHPPAVTGEGWPGASAGVAADVVAPPSGLDGATAAGSDGLVVGWGGLKVSRPTTPSISGATAADTSGADRLR